MTTSQLPVTPKMPETPCDHGHLAELVTAIGRFDDCVDVADRWGEHLAKVLDGGGRLLAAGNGGSAAQAQHLTAELVGRYRDDRRPFSAIRRCAESRRGRGVGNDSGPGKAFPPQVSGPGPPPDRPRGPCTPGAPPNLPAGG